MKNGYLSNFWVDYNTIDVSDIADIHNYLMEKFSFRESSSFRGSLTCVLFLTTQNVYL